MDESQANGWKDPKNPVRDGETDRDGTGELSAPASKPNSEAPGRDRPLAPQWHVFGPMAALPHLKEEVKALNHVVELILVKPRVHPDKETVVRHTIAVTQVSDNAVIDVSKPWMSK